MDDAGQSQVASRTSQGTHRLRPSYPNPRAADRPEAAHSMRSNTETQDNRIQEAHRIAHVHQLVHVFDVVRAVCAHGPATRKRLRELRLTREVFAAIDVTHAESAPMQKRQYAPEETWHTEALQHIYLRWGQPSFWSCLITNPVPSWVHASFRIGFPNAEFFAVLPWTRAGDSRRRRCR